MGGGGWEGEEGGGGEADVLGSNAHHMILGKIVCPKLFNWTATNVSP